MVSLFVLHISVNTTGKRTMGEFDEEDLEDNDLAIPRRYVEEDKIIFDSFGNLRGQMI